MATIRVNSTVMRDKANGFRTVSAAINSFTSEMIQEMENLKTSYQGEAADALIGKFNSLSTKFKEICDTINAYGTFLDEAANSYDRTQDAIKQGAEGQRS